MDRPWSIHCCPQREFRLQRGATRWYNCRQIVGLHISDTKQNYKMVRPCFLYFAHHFDFTTESVTFRENLDYRVGQLDGTHVDKYYLTWTTYIGHRTKL